MSWSSGYNIVEQQIINVYNANKLNKNLLDAIMAPFANKDVEYGGFSSARTHNGKTAEQIIIEAFGDTYPIQLDNSENDEEIDKHNEEIFSKMRLIMNYYNW